MRISKLLFFPALLVGVTLFSAETRAGLITLDGTSSSGANTFFSYAIAVPSGDSIATGNFFRIYDFDGYVPGSITAPAGWTASVALTNNVPPPTVVLNHGDDPAIFNLVFTYTGSTPLLPGAPITGFTATTTDNAISANPKDAVAQFTSTSSPGVGSFDAYIGNIAVPTNVAVPEPASMISSGLGMMILAAGYGIRGRRKMSV